MHIRPFLPPPVVFYLNNDSTLKIEDIRISVAATPKETEHFFHLVQEQFLIQGFNILKTNPNKDEKELRALAVDRVLGFYEPFARYTHRFQRITTYWKKFRDSCAYHAAKKWRELKPDKRITYDGHSNSQLPLFYQHLRTQRSDSPLLSETQPEYLISEGSRFQDTYWQDDKDKAAVTFSDLDFFRYVRQSSQDLELDQDGPNAWYLVCPEIGAVVDNQRVFRTALAIMYFRGRKLWFRYERTPTSFARLLNTPAPQISTASLQLASSGTNPTLVPAYPAGPTVSSDKSPKAPTQGPKNIGAKRQREPDAQAESSKAPKVSRVRELAPQQILEVAPFTKLDKEAAEPQKKDHTVYDDSELGEIVMDGAKRKAQVLAAREAALRRLDGLADSTDPDEAWDLFTDLPGCERWDIFNDAIELFRLNPATIEWNKILWESI
ncbi:hypothetical protein OEA41_010646 [Lepraria neglecta]|uniref:Uncharacterized protein n=1 Tax=Lepraria neglecta TaxID=209136 RepID=A0AAD9YWS6_9LECA|nr:hypothetical protein OEA41_010646 [Lepraria neglecta]